MKKRKIYLHIILCILVLFMIISIGSCKPYPIYMSYAKEDGFQYITIGNVEYRKGSGEWGLDYNKVGGVIGYLNNYSTVIYDIKDDVNKQYLYIRINTGLYDPYFRTDYIYPEVKKEAFNKIVWADTQGNQEISDDNLVKSLFDELDQNEYIHEDGIEVGYATIYCYFDQLPGLCYSLSVIYKNGKFLCGSYPNNNFVEISADLITQLSGHGIDFEQLNEVLRQSMN